MKLYRHQREGIDRLVQLRRALLADEPGVGKTLTALVATQELDGYPALVIPPASLKINWQRQAQQHLGLSVQILSGRKPQRSEGADLTVVNYDLVPSRLKELAAGDYKTLIPDEAHYLCNRLSKRTKAVRILSRGAENVFCLSATPVTNRPGDLWSILNVVRPDLYDSFFSFCHKFTRMRKRPWGWVPEGSRNLDELHRMLVEQLMIRRRKEDILDLPAKRRIVVPVELPQRRQYEAARKDFLGWLLRHDPSRVSGAERSRGLAVANRLKQLVGLLKVPSVVAWAEDWLESSGHKLILFAHHREVIEGLQARFGKGAVKVYGGLTDKARQRAFDAFEQEESVRVLVGQIESAGQGWSCKATSEQAFAELDWRAVLIDQACERTHGVGRGAGRDSTSYFLVADDTVEEDLMRAIEKKGKLARSVVDGGEGEVLELFADFCKAVKEGLR